MSSLQQTRGFLRAFSIAIIPLLLIGRFAIAAPAGPSNPLPASLNSTPDWMTGDIVDQLSAVGFTVLAPSYIPGPFSSLPSVSASSGYYSLYWVIPGTPPTYLMVIGGDTIPDYSKYDRNTPLTQNDTVMGYPAWHDQTPDYDLVYFVMDGVVYSVESNNLSGDTTMDIANSMAAVDTVAQEAPPTDVPATSTDDTGDTGSDASTDTGSEATDDSGDTAPEDTPTETSTDQGSDTSDASSTDESEASSDDTSSSSDSEDTSDSSDESSSSDDDSGASLPEAASEPSIDAPDSVESGDEVDITIDGVSGATLSASSGTFAVSGRSDVQGAESSTFRWTAPETQAGRTVRFKLTDSDSGDLLATATTTVKPVADDDIPVVAGKLSCPKSIPMGSYAGISVTGAGELQLDASDGTFPDVGPNATFAGKSKVDGGNTLQGVARKEKTFWVFWQPDTASSSYMAYIFLQNWDGNTLLECGVRVVVPDATATYPAGLSSDATGGSTDVGYAPLDSIGDGTDVNSDDYPAAGQLSDGSTLAIAAATPATIATPGAANDGTLVTEPSGVSGATPIASPAP